MKKVALQGRGFEILEVLVVCRAQSGCGKCDDYT